MKVRRHLRFWTALAVVLQSAWLFAIVPADCCAAHVPSRASKSCHEEVKPPDCPMMGTSGAACPMHQAGTHQADAATDCAMRASCRGPMAGLISLLSATAILSGPLQFDPLPAITAQVSPTRDERPSRSSPPEAPPPRL